MSSSAAAAASSQQQPRHLLFDADSLRATVFTSSNILYFIWFLGVLLILYASFSVDRDIQSRIINVVVIVWLLYLITYTYLQLDPFQQTYFLHAMLDMTLEFFNSPIAAFWVGTALIALYVVTYLLAVPMDSENKPEGVWFLESKLWITLVIFAIVFFFRYVLHIPLADLIYRFTNDVLDWISGGQWSKKYDGAYDGAYNVPLYTASGGDASGNVVYTASGGSVPTVSGKDKKEVFNVASNMYTYDDARAVCDLYGARLATYEDVEHAYNDGAEWCNYGWSEGQMAFFPTQTSTWSSLQKDPLRKHDCGRPGVNGGFFDNPELRFGVNCFGVKPAPSAANEDYLVAQRTRPIASALSDVDLKTQAKIQFWKENADKLLLLNGYNATQWSEY